MGVPILRDGQFRGMCALGLSLRSLAEQLGAPQSAGAAGVALVDRDGAPLGGDPRATAALPVASRLAGAIAAAAAVLLRLRAERRAYDFSIRPLAGGTLFAVGAHPVRPQLLRAAARLG